MVSASAKLRLPADPLNPDSDGDTLSDGDEVALFGTDPCNPDTDNDGLRDDVDPNPLVPDQSGGDLEQDLRALADGILTLDLGLFNGHNNNANRGRRNALANRATDAANALSASDVVTAIDEMSSLLDKIDAQSLPPDWMAAAQEKADLADEMRALIAALELLCKWRNEAHPETALMIGMRQIWLSKARGYMGCDFAAAA